MQILIYTAWAIVVIAAVASVIVRRTRSNKGPAGILRSRSTALVPVDRAALRAQIRVGIRIALLLAIPLVIYAGVYAGQGWWILGVLVAAVWVPLVTIPITILHAILIRFLAFRGPLTTVAMGVVVGSIAGRFTGVMATPFVIYGGGFGFIMALRHAMSASPGIVPDKTTANDSLPA